MIVLTGATEPACCLNSDAAFNIGLAVGAVTLLPPGVYIVMNGRIHRWDQCEKNDLEVFVHK